MNYFNYFTEIEERFQQRRGTLLMLSTLDWALIETWREAGVPLEAVLRGIDDAFDKHDARSRQAGTRIRKVNGLAWCAQAVMTAAEQAKEAAIGISATPTEPQESGFEQPRIAQYLKRNAALLEVVTLPSPADALAAETATRLRSLALEPTATLEELDRTLTALEERLTASLLAAAPEDEIVALKAQADRELAPYKSRMGAVQIRQVQQQFLHKRLLESCKLPRLSLFYMSHEG